MTPSDFLYLIITNHQAALTVVTLGQENLLVAQILSYSQSPSIFTMSAHINSASGSERSPALVGRRKWQRRAKKTKPVLRFDATSTSGFPSALCLQPLGLRLLTPEEQALRDALNRVWKHKAGLSVSSSCDQLRQSHETTILSTF